jgi:hypothetical protein
MCLILNIIRRFGSNFVAEKELTGPAPWWVKIAWLKLAFGSMETAFVGIAPCRKEMKGRIWHWVEAFYITCGNVLWSYVGVFDYCYFYFLISSNHDFTESKIRICFVNNVFVFFTFLLLMQILVYDYHFKLIFHSYFSLCYTLSRTSHLFAVKLGGNQAWCWFKALG